LIVVPVHADAGDGDDGHVYALDVELALMRHWVFAPGFDPALLLGRMQAHIESLDAARAYELEHARDLTAEVRAQARLARRMATQLSVEPGPPAVPPAGLAVLRERVQRLARNPRALAGVVAAEALRRWRGAPPPAGAPAAGLIPVARPGRVWAPPHVAVLVDGDGTPDRTGDALAWAAQQTCASTEVIVWSRTDGLAWDARQPHAKWRAADWPALHATLAARYVVFASADLFAQAPIYLERALLALEPEDLCFAITVGAELPSAATAIATGRGPGSSGNLLPRTIARPEIVTETGLLDLDAARAERGAAGGALGKLLGDTGARPDEGPAFAVPLVGAPVGVLGTYVVADPTPGAVMLHPIAAADRVLDLPPLPSDLPTVVMVFPFLAVGGAERVHLDVVRGLREQIRFVIAAIEPHDDRLGSTVAAFRELTPYVYTAPDALHPLLTTSFFEHLFQRFAPRTLYIANGSAWIYDALPTLKAMYPGLRTVDQVYDTAAGWIERLDGPTIAAIDAHISCNRHISAALVGRGAAPDAAVTVHNAPDLSLFDPAVFDAERRAALAERFGLPPGRRIVAFIGRMHQQKRPMDVVELARQLRGDSRLAFLMVGDGPLAETVRAQVATSGLDNIRVHAFHQPSSECYAVADVLLLPSEYEGMPMVILEALAMGVPVVATDVGNNREVLTRTGGGRIVDRVGDLPALRQAVLATLDAPADPDALRAAVEREFGMTAMLDDYARVLLGDR
jgi:glycosyltransferase involved in cell wall biosynthesis